MAVYKEMDPELALKLIEGYQDELTPQARTLEAFYRQFRCPRCKGELQKEFDTRHTFSDPDTAVGRALLRCPTCAFLIDPHSNLVLESGSPAKIPIEAIRTIK
jgi:hypothetical protein